MSTPKPEAVERAQAWLTEHEPEMIEDTRLMLRIASVEGPALPGAPFGKECKEALDLALSMGAKWGMRTRDVDGYAGHCEFGDGNAMVMALGHLDVVPVGDGWVHEPFGAEIDGEYLYSRGAIDDKGPTMAAFYALRALKETGADVPSRMRIVFGCDEESGFKCVEHYFKHEEAPTYGVAPDSGWPCYHGEKGIATFKTRIPAPKGAIELLDLEAGSRPNIVPAFAKAYVRVSNDYVAEFDAKLSALWDKNISHKRVENEYVLEAVGRAAHGAMPFLGDNALTRVLRALMDCAPIDMKDWFWKLVEMGHPSGVGFGIHGRDDGTGDLTSNLAIAELRGHSIEFTTNVRYPVSWTGEQLKKKIVDHLEKEWPGAEVIEFSDSKGLFFPIDKEPIVSIVQAYRMETGDMAEPGVMGGGTYARAVPNTVSIGTGWDGDGPAHEHDERIKVAHLLKMAKIYAHILYRLAHAAAKVR
jgi:succinyl-diaminopimelate desuccinylase